MNASLKIGEIPQTAENMRLVNKALESGDERGLAKGCLFAYLCTQNEGWLIRAQSYAERSEKPFDLTALMLELGGSMARLVA
jgi:hypothetical protein